MFGVVGTLFVGYWLLTYGFSQIRSCNAGFFEIVWPGAYKGCNPDTGTSSPFGPGTSTPGYTPLGTKNISGVTISSAAQAQSILNNPKSSQAQKSAAGAYLYTQAAQG